MISQNSLRGGKGYCVLLLSLVLGASGCEGPSAERKEPQGEAFEAFLMKTPLVTVLAAGTYYENFGRWPGSVRDLEALQGEDFRDVDWESLRDTIVFEEIPDGGLKIISTDPHIRFTITLSGPTDSEENSQGETRGVVGIW